MVDDFFAIRCDLFPRWRILGCMSRFLDIDLPGETLRRAAAGDREARQQVFERTAGPAFGLIRRLVRGQAAAEDVFQDCMVSLLRHLPDYRGDAPFGAWVRQVAVRQCLMHLRSPWQRARGLLDRDTGDARPSLDERSAMDGAQELPLADLIDLERALARLPLTARAVVWMHDAEGLTHEEIAAAFGRSVSFSKSQLARAHALLRGELAVASAPRAASGAPVAAQGQWP